MSNSTSSSSPLPLVICGPSGVGKGTLLEYLMKEALPDNFAFSVSHTTRGPRPGEVDGVHYNFTEKDSILKMIDNGEFMEYAEVHGNYYGTSYAGLAQPGKIVVLDIDVQGVQKVKVAVEEGKIAGARYVFIRPTNLEVLEKRLRDRGTETEDAILKRTANAKAEMEYGEVEGNFDKVVVNDGLEEAKVEIRGIVRELYGI
jgi:guanylate kinase